MESRKYNKRVKNYLLWTCLKKLINIWSGSCNNLNSTWMQPTHDEHTSEIKKGKGKMVKQNIYRHCCHCQQHHFKISNNQSSESSVRKKVEKKKKNKVWIRDIYENQGLQTKQNLLMYTYTSLYSNTPEKNNTCDNITISHI